MTETPQGAIQKAYFPCAPRKELSRIWQAFESLTSNPHPQSGLWAAAMAHYYGEGAGFGPTWAVTRGGQEQELASVRVNTARPLAKAKVALVTASQVTWAVREKQDSAAAGYATSLSRALLEDAWTRQGMGAMDVQWQEMAEVLTTGYVFTEWDRTRGPDAVIDASQGVRLSAGDVRMTLLPPWFVATDPTRSNADEQDWWFIGLDRPKADLVHLFPEVLDGDGTVLRGHDAAERILGARTAYDLSSSNTWHLDDKLQTLARVVHFIHRPTLSLPLGRHVIMLDGSTILRDSSLIGDDGDYEMTPLVRRASDERIGTCFGYSSFLDILGPQEILDAYHTTQSTIITTYGNPVLAYEKGTDTEPQDAAVFGRPWAYPPGGRPPGFVQPAEPSEGAFKYAESLVQSQQMQMSLNDAALGQPQTAERNAQAEALFASMAVQQAGPAVLARRRSLSQLGQVYLTTLRKNVQQPRLARMVGSGQANLLADTKEWTGKDLGPLDSVEVEEVPPEQATIQGRWAILEQHMKVNPAMDAGEMEQVRSTGRINRVVDPIRDAKQLQSVQYEQLSRGELPLVHPTANGPIWYKSNASVLLSISALANDKVRQAVELTLALRYCLFFGLPPTGPDGAPTQPKLVDPLYVDRVRFLMSEGPLPQPMPPPGAPVGAGGPPMSGPGAELAAGPPPGPEMPNGAQAANALPPDLQTVNPATGSAFSPTNPPV